MTKLEFQHTFEDLVKLPHGSVQLTDSRATIKAWESFVDVDLLVIIEKELNIQVEAEIMEQETFGDLVRLLESKGAFAGTTTS